jgi:hypothetical protein
VRVQGGWFLLDISALDSGEIAIPIANRGRGVAEIEYAKIRIDGRSLGPGAFESSFPEHGPRVEPGDKWTLRFSYSSKDVVDLKQARKGTLILDYMSASDGRRYQLVATIGYEDTGQWQLLEEATRQID